MNTSILSPVLDTLRAYFDERLESTADSSLLSVRDDELGDLASCCTVGEVASFYVCDWKLRGGDGQDIAEALALDVRRRQLPSGAFGQPYYVLRGESPTIDIAEIGAVANALYHVHRNTGSEAASAALTASADYLLTQVATENPGAVYKNPSATNHDVLNGDIYAAHTWGRAFQTKGRDVYRQKVHDVLSHVAHRFGQHDARWWPYTETWDGQIGMGNSVSYQATIIAFAHTCLPILEEALRRQWTDTSEVAVRTVIRELREGPSEENEAPFWSHDWQNTWEVYLALSRHQNIHEARDMVSAQLVRIKERLDTDGVACFRPKITNLDPNRTPLSTTFRKAATFAGILSYMLLDEEEKNESCI